MILGFLEKTILLFGLGVFVIIVAIFNLIPPSDVKPPVMLLIFGLIYYLFFSLALAIRLIITSLLNLVNDSKIIGRLKTVNYMNLLVLSFCPVALLATQSIREVKLIDFLMVSVLAGLVIFYTKKR